MQGIIDELKLDRIAHAAGFEQQWELTRVRILIVNGSDAGWMQSVSRDGEIFLAQIFVDGPFQGRGIGTRAISELLAEAAEAGQAVCLGVAKINRAIRLYERLGFRIVGEDDRKLYMRRDPEKTAPLSSCPSIHGKR
jgi:ribosomal protein S18 acetylase RimI-like enzyme